MSKRSPRDELVKGGAVKKVNVGEGIESNEPSVSDSSPSGTGKSKLKALVMEWAENDENECDTWMQSLQAQGIKSVDRLLKRAKSQRAWKMLLDDLDDGGLIAALEDWKEQRYKVERMEMDQGKFVCFSFYKCPSCVFS